MKFLKRHPYFVLVFYFVALAALFVTCGRVWAAWGTRVVHYSQTDLIPIRAKIRFSTLIVLPANEDILDFTTGDKGFWIINGVHSLYYVHPAQAGIKSNLNLIAASGHIYSFLLTEISNQPDLKVFVIPKDESSVAAVGGQVKYVRQSEVEAYKQGAEVAQAQGIEEIQQGLTDKKFGTFSRARWFGALDLPQGSRRCPSHSCRILHSHLSKWSPRLGASEVAQFVWQFATVVRSAALR